MIGYIKFKGKICLDVLVLCFNYWDSCIAIFLYYIFKQKVSIKNWRKKWKREKKSYKQGWWQYKKKRLKLEVGNRVIPKS